MPDSDRVKFRRVPSGAFRSRVFAPRRSAVSVEIERGPPRLRRVIKGMHIDLNEAAILPGDGAGAEDRASNVITVRTRRPPPPRTGRRRDNQSCHWATALLS